MQVGWVKIGDFRQIAGYISKTVQDRRMVSIKVVCALSNGDFAVGSRVVSVLDSGTEGPGFKSQPRRCRVTVLGKLFTPIVPLFTKQQNW